MLKHLPPNAVNTLLQALNNIWFAGNFPPIWRTSTVIPIPKPVKDTSDAKKTTAALRSRAACVKLWIV